MKLPTVYLREKHPPHKAIFAFRPPAITYGFGVMKEQNAAFALSRADPNFAAFPVVSTLLDGPMISIERDDGRWPWVGWATVVDLALGDPTVQVECKDAAWLLRQARTEKSGTITGTDEDLIERTVRAMNDRGEPPLYIGLGGVKSVAAVEYTYRLEDGLQFLQNVARATGAEWGWAHDVRTGGVMTSLVYAERLGRDRRQEVVWQEQRHFTAARFSQRADGFINTAIAVGGTGDVGSRAAVAAGPAARSESGITGVTAREAIRPSSTSPVFRRTSIAFSRNVTDEATLTRSARKMLNTPEQVGRQLSVTVFEDAVGMQWALGDTIALELEKTLLGFASRVIGRPIAIKMGLDGRHDVEIQVVEVEGF